MSSQVAGIQQGGSPIIPMYRSDGSYKYYNVFSRDTTGNFKAHFPYPWIPDSGFPRPSNGYKMSGTPDPYYNLAVWSTDSTLATVTGVKKTGGTMTSTNMHGCIFSPPGSSGRYMWLNPDKLENRYALGPGSLFYTNPTGAASVVYGQSSTQWRAPKFQHTPYSQDYGLKKYSITHFVGMTFIKNTTGGTTLWDSPSGGIYYELSTGSGLKSAASTVDVIYSRMPDMYTTYKLYRISCNACINTGYTADNGSIFFYLPKLQWNISDMSSSEEWTIKVNQVTAFTIFGTW